jgi:secreted PhoX family phosphatase
MFSLMRSTVVEVISNTLYRPSTFRWIVLTQPATPSNVPLNNRIQLGRWDHNVTKEQLNRRIDLANIDNCACSYPDDWAH